MKLNINQGLTSFQLKIIGITLMVCDHIHQMFVYQGAPTWLNMVGRLAAPIFLSSEGFYYTHNKKRYMTTLWIGFVFCNIIFFAISSAYPNPNAELMNNIFGTLFLGTVFMWISDSFRGENKYPWKAIAASILVLIGSILPMLLSGITDSTIGMFIFRIVYFTVPSLMTVEGGVIYPLLALSFYLLRNNKKFQLLPFIILSIGMLITTPSDYQWMMGLAAIPLYI